MGGKPSKGTPADKRLKGNRSSTPAKATPPPMPAPRVMPPNVKRPPAGY